MMGCLFLLFFLACGTAAQRWLSFGEPFEANCPSFPTQLLNVSAPGVISSRVWNYSDYRCCTQFQISLSSIEGADCVRSPVRGSPCQVHLISTVSQLDPPLSTSFGFLEAAIYYVDISFTSCSAPYTFTWVEFNMFPLLELTERPMVDVVSTIATITSGNEYSTVTDVPWMRFYLASSASAIYLTLKSTPTMSGAVEMYAQINAPPTATTYNSWCSTLTATSCSLTWDTAQANVYILVIGLGSSSLRAQFAISIGSGNDSGSSSSSLSSSQIGLIVGGAIFILVVLAFLVVFRFWKCVPRRGGEETPLIMESTRS